MAFVENQGAKIYWDEQGRGAPVLLITGLGYPSDMWHRTRPVLSEHSKPSPWTTAAWEGAMRHQVRILSR